MGKKSKKNSKILKTYLADGKEFLYKYQTTLTRSKLYLNTLKTVLYTFFYLLLIFTFGLCLIPSVYFFIYMNALDVGAYKPLVLTFTLPACFVLFGFSQLFVIPAMSFLNPFKMKAWRGPYYSPGAFPWIATNFFTYLTRYTFGDFMTPSPVNNFFYKSMGMKIGENVELNTTNISDPPMISLGNNVTIGGSATVIAHYASNGFLIIAPVIIKDNVTVGIKSTIMGDVIIEKGARVLPNSVVMPKTRIKENEIWGGVPATFIQKREKVKKHHHHKEHKKDNQHQPTIN